ncbi:hypothetical protein NT6N_04240 [Oceaniferula spumae]|uniref:Secreted protein n=1 Tax=Oceaniferula spumae TaxID=2979115 RepID=A0AAT9FHF2_9BACT
MKTILLLITPLLLALHVGATESAASEKDPFEGVFDNPFGMAIEYPLTKQYDHLDLYKVITWSSLNALKSNMLVEGQIDGFIKVYSAKVESGKDEGKVVHRFLLYKSKEDMKYKRLSSCIVLSDYSYGVLPNNGEVKEPKQLDGKYCIAAGIFRRAGGATAVSARSVGLAYPLFIK